jgi:hypothetical protein
MGWRQQAASVKRPSKQSGDAGRWKELLKFNALADLK